MTAFIAAVVEAWGEFKVQKARVLLSLIGVALSVAALASVVGVGDLARASMQQSQEKYSGRTATIQTYFQTMAAKMPADARQKIDELADRCGLKYVSLKGSANGSFQFINGAAQTQISIVDPAYDVIHRLKVSRGSWFAADDAQRLTPALVVNEKFYDAMGRPDLNKQPEVEMTGDTSKTTVVIGVVPNEYEQAQPMAYGLPGIATEGAGDFGGMSLEIWVQPEQAQQLAQALRSDFAAIFPNVPADVRRSDYAALGDPFASAQLLIAGIAALVMFLGVLSLLNITLVTIRYRVREIGIRRSFGATGGRVFFGVLMESVVATTVAGILGVMAAIVLVKNPWIESKIGPGMTDYPPFPVSAALIGLGAAILAGAVAGALPALVAVRVKVIDAIRF